MKGDAAKIWQSVQELKSQFRHEFLTLDGPMYQHN